MARETVAGTGRGRTTPRVEGMRRERRARGCVHWGLTIMVLAVASARSVAATTGRGEYRRRRQQLARTMPENNAWKLRNMVDRARFAHDDAGLLKETMTSGRVRDRSVEEEKKEEEKKEEEKKKEEEEEEEDNEEEEEGVDDEEEE